jgi:hypothetical protein
MLSMVVLRRFDVGGFRLMVGNGWLFDFVEDYSYGYDCYKRPRKVIQCARKESGCNGVIRRNENTLHESPGKTNAKRRSQNSFRLVSPLYINLILGTN